MENQWVYSNRLTGCQKVSKGAAKGSLNELIRRFDTDLFMDCNKQEDVKLFK